MRNRKGVTLIELMVVVLIVAVLAAVLVPLLTARLESARWAEGKAGAGTIATAIRAMYAEQGEEDFASSTDVLTYCEIGDLRGKYFDYQDYTLSNVAIDNTPGTEYPVTYTIQVDPPENSTVTVTWNKVGYTLDHTGKWTELSPP